MKLVHKDLERQIVFKEPFGCCEWIIESPQLFSKYLYELYAQTEGREGCFVLSNDDKTLEISKCSELILQPLSVNINDKKILNKLYVELEKLAFNEDMFLLTQEMRGKLQEYFFNLEQRCTYSLAIEDDINILSIFKAVGIKCEKYLDDIFENLIEYIKIVSHLLNKKLFIFVNIRSYICDEQLKQLLKETAYTEVNILLIENKKRSCLYDVAEYIIDCDNCEI